MTILIGGGTGFIGRNLVRHLKNNYEIIVVTRNPKKKGEISWTQIESSGIPKEVDTVINLAGRSVAEIGGYLKKDFLKDCYESRLGTNRTLVKAIRNMENPPELFLSMSGVGYYPSSDIAVYDENGPNGSDWLARLAREWEKAANLPPSIPTRRVIIRSGVVIGPDGGVMKEMKPISKIPFFVPIAGMGTGEQFFPWIHITDMVRLIQFLMENKHLKGNFNGVAEEVINNKTFTLAVGAILAALSNKRLLLLPNLSAEVVHKMHGKDIASMLLEGQNVNPLRAKRAGFTYNYEKINNAVFQTVSTWLKK